VETAGVVQKALARDLHAFSLVQMGWDAFGTAEAVPSNRLEGTSLEVPVDGFDDEVVADALDDDGDVVRQIAEQ
jgi:hypothetical protein